MTIKFTNNAATSLASGITNVATSLTVASGKGALFPTLSGGDVFYVTLANSSGVVEIVQVTARSTDTFTIVRGQDGTSAVAWNTGDKVELRPTAGVLGAMVQSANLSTSAVTSAVAGTGISVSGATGAVTIGNTGVTSVTAGTGISVSASTGGVTITNSAPNAAVDVQTFTSTGTWTKPTGGQTMARIQLWGGGGGAGNGTYVGYAGGGGGGSYNEITLPLSYLASTMTATVGAGGAAGASGSTNGGNGGLSTVTIASAFAGQTVFNAYGGNGGSYTAGNSCSGSGNGGGAGGTTDAPPTAATWVPAAGIANMYQTQGGQGGNAYGTTFHCNSPWGGGGGGDGNGITNPGAPYSTNGGNSYWGGAGGGGSSNNTTYAAGGISRYGGNGGAGGNNASRNGTAPGGGGGGAYAGSTVGGSGAAGRIIITSW